MEHPTLCIEHVTKAYGKFTALEDITLTLENGVYGLLAPNGAGKTTLLKMLTTLLYPTSGTILWNGEDIRVLGADYRTLIGYLPQDFGYYKNRTPRQFLRYMSALQGMDAPAAEKRIDELLALVALTQVQDKKMREFSGGMIQRVGIAQALLNDPKFLILDEPTAGLDPKERVRFRNLLHKISADRIVVLSTHIVSDIETIAEQIVMIRDHKLFCCDSPADICAGLAGKLFEVPENTTLTDGQLLLSECQTAQGAMLRILADDPPDGALPVAPNLEDAFLSLYRDDAL